MTITPQEKAKESLIFKPKEQTKADYSDVSLTELF
jgi:hypothetical protein